MKELHAKYKAYLKKHKWLAVIIDTLTTVGMFAIAAGIGIFIALGKNVGNAEDYAKNYFSHYINQEWMQMYDCFDIEETEYINRDSFVNAMESKVIYGEFDDSKVKLTKKKGKYAYVDITYTDANTKEEKTVSVKLTKQDKKVYMFFDTWKIDSESFIVDNCSVVTPADTTFYFDGKDMSDENHTTSEGITTYKIDRLFKGEYDFAINNAYIDSYHFLSNVDTDSAKVDLNLEEYTLKKQDETYVRDAAKKVVFGLYSSACAKEGYEAYKQYFMQDKDGGQVLASCYDQLLNSLVNEDGGYLQSISIDSYVDYISSYRYPSEVEVKINYTCSYTARTKRTQYTGIRGEYSGVASENVVIRFRRSGESFLISEIELKCIDFSK